ncbi:hypothetical protein BDA96_02G350000 [Sorghum bicolor]|uniref:Pterin-binding domain-containing protein n=1 Tax=Sorghum bicolor TaxID=4558 RepID=A0A921UXF9_SORBI|nr:hypothetical protein BDA96_02G350000 [Sorghum bicolor]
MAPFCSSVASRGLALQTALVVSPPPRCRGTPVISASPHAHRQSLIGSTTTNSSGTSPIKRTTRIRAVDPASANSLGEGNLVIPIQDLLSVLSWPWMFGAAIAAAVPLYRRFRTLEDNVEKAAEAAIEVIDSVAEATEKVAVDVAEAFPGNETLKQAASKIKAIADEIEEDADKAEALIEKVDDIKKEVDSIIDPLIDKVTKNKS